MPTTVATLCLLVPGIDGAQSGAGADLALRQFENNVASYLALRQQVSAGIVGVSDVGNRFATVRQQLVGEKPMTVVGPLTLE